MNLNYTRANKNIYKNGDWGVDVVETLVGDNFLQGISWEETIATKSVDQIFKVELCSKNLDKNLDKNLKMGLENNG
jgi:hypothetical protein